MVTEQGSSSAFDKNSFRVVEMEDELKVVKELIGSKEIEAGKIVHLRNFVGKESREMER